MITRGHHATNGGLRGHSTGDLYPYSVTWHGSYSGGSWGLFDCRNGAFLMHGSIRSVEGAARLLKRKEAVNAAQSIVGVE